MSIPKWQWGFTALTVAIKERGTKMDDEKGMMELLKDYWEAVQSETELGLKVLLGQLAEEGSVKVA